MSAIRPQPIKICRRCGDPVPHIHPDSDDPLGESVPVAHSDALTTPTPHTPIAKLGPKQSVIVDFEAQPEADDLVPSEDVDLAFDRMFRP